MEKRYVNLTLLKEKKSVFREGGASKIHVLADFDRTLTKYFVGGEYIPSVISILRDGNYLSKDYKEQASALYDEYRPIEMDQKVDSETKRKKMEEWWRRHFDLLIRSGLNMEDLERVVKSNKIVFRNSALAFLDYLYKKRIPLVILSSNGLGGDSISMLLKRENVLYDNIHIVSNSFEWDERGNAIAVKEPIITSANKHEVNLENLAIYNELKKRRNVILLGDSLGDLGMIEGFDYNRLIKIGFLNENVEEQLEEYRKKFDIVITGDGSFKYVNLLLKEVTSRLKSFK